MLRLHGVLNMFLLTKQVVNVDELRTNVKIRQIYTRSDPFVFKHAFLENLPFIDDSPIAISINSRFPIAMFDCQWLIFVHLGGTWQSAYVCRL